MVPNSETVTPYPRSYRYGGRTSAKHAQAFISTAGNNIKRFITIVPRNTKDMTDVNSTTLVPAENNLKNLPNYEHIPNRPSIKIDPLLSTFDVFSDS